MKLKKDISIVTNFNLMAQSLIAGILIGLGVIINAQTSPPILGAFLFSFGLLTIIKLKLPLYTGKIGFLAPQLPSILFWNMIGIALTVLLYCYNNIEFWYTLTQLAEIKFAKTWFQMLISGIFCGALIHFAVKCKEWYITSLAVIIFILIGAEHCVADFPYLLTNLSFINCGKLGLVILGNSLGAIFIERMIEDE